MVLLKYRFAKMASSTKSYLLVKYVTMCLKILCTLHEAMNLKILHALLEMSLSSSFLILLSESEMTLEYCEIMKVISQYSMKVIA